MLTQPLSPESFQTFGDLLRFLRRRERLTQLELSIAVGYSEAQIGRLEQNQRKPDVTAVKALFIPALHLGDEPALAERLLELARSARQEDAPAAGIAPYKGLLFFDQADADLFFGRETLTAHLVERVTVLDQSASSRFLVVVGASGSGKSSLVRAGMAVTLQRVGWKIHIFTPTTNPLKMLAMHAPAPAAQNGQPHLLVVDQFEETFTLCHDDSERVAFIEQLICLAQDHTTKTMVVIALRADFYSHCAQYPLLREAVAAQQEYIGQMSRAELRLAIEEPARDGGWEFERGLVDVLLNDIGADGSGQPEPGALPLLSHALLATWARRRGRTLTLEGYRASGGVRGAIAETAESVFTDQLNRAQQDLARDIFLRLTELGEGTEDTRRRATLNELAREAEEAMSLRTVLNTLADARLITLNEDSAEVAHEALIREWQRLHEWLTADREGLRLHRHLTDAALEWEARERDASELYRGARLAQTSEWAATNEQRLNELERAFLQASLAQEQHEAQQREAQRQRELEAARKLADTERQSVMRLRRRNRALAVAGALVTAAAIIAIIFGGQANANATRADQNAAQAQTNLSIAQANAATAQAASGLANQERGAAVNSQATAVAESQVRATQQAIAEGNFRYAEAQRLGAEANKLLLTNGDSEQIALLSLRSLNTQYSPEGDAALLGAVKQDYARRLFTGPTDQINVVTFSPDGKYALAGSNDKTAWLWDLTTGQVVHQLVGHTDAVKGAAFSPDGKYILTGSWDKTARLWDAATGQEVRRFNNPALIGAVAYSPDGKYVLTSSGDGIPRLWDAATGQVARQFIGHTGRVRSVAFSPDGKYVLTGGVDGTARLWDATTGKQVRQFTRPYSFGLAFSPDGKNVAIGGDGIWVLDAQTGQDLHHITQASAQWAFSPDWKYLVFIATGEGNANRLHLLDVQTGQEVRQFSGHPGPLAGEVFSPDGQSILTGNSDGTVRLWDVKSSFELPSLNNSSAVGAVAFSPDGKFALTGDNDGAARLWNAATGQKLRDFVGHTGPINYGLAFSPDGKYVLTGSSDKTVRLWDAVTGQALQAFTATGPVNSVAFSPDGKYILAGSDDKLAWLWNAASGELVRQFLGGGVGINGVQYAAFSPDGQYVATASMDGTTRLFDTATGQELRRLTSTGGVNSVAFSPDGRYILTAGYDKAAHLWDVQTGQEVRQFIGHTIVIWSATFSPDGKYVATGSGGGDARLWDTATGKELRRFITTGPVNSVAFSPDGHYLLTGNNDVTAQLWDIDYHVSMHYLCSHLLRDFTAEERVQFGITDQGPTCPAQ